ncbi:MAG TPA: hypothetical protein VFR23_11605 [Jiangellaceae bacterium]|nr:hypothetical protein [Jiangellaceae bacterium]
MWLPDSIAEWQQVGTVCVAILAVLTLVGLVYRKVIRPVLRAAWRTIRRLNLVADDLLGDKARKIPSMTERMAALEGKLDDHLSWHNDPRGRPARKPSRTSEQYNGPLEPGR